MDIKISLSPEAEAKLKARAAARGQDVGQYAAEIVEQAVSAVAAVGQPVSQPVPSDRLASWNAFVARMCESGAKLPPGYVADDGRDGIYAGRGE